MSAIDDLISRAVKTEALPFAEIEVFAEGTGKIELFQELMQEGAALNNLQAIEAVDRVTLLDELIAAALEDAGGAG